MGFRGRGRGSVAGRPCIGGEAAAAAMTASARSPAASPPRLRPSSKVRRHTAASLVETRAALSSRSLDRAPKAPSFGRFFSIASCKPPRASSASRRLPASARHPRAPARSPVEEVALRGTAAGRDLLALPNAAPRQPHPLRRQRKALAHVVLGVGERGGYAFRHASVSTAAP